jgi:hypothetical protein
MRKMLLGGAAALLGLAALAGPAAAQYPRPTMGAPFTGPNFGPGYRPAMNPYLGLELGNIPAVNYGLGTLPVQQQRQNAQMFRQQILDLERRTAVAPEDVDLLGPSLMSGHPTAFGNTAGYFNNMSPRLYGQGAVGPTTSSSSSLRR